jgi:hypothetical protein
LGRFHYKEVKEMPERKWVREVIKIDTDCGPVAIPAKVLGPIAVHFGVGSHAGRISITHLGTGRRIASTGIPDVARRVAEELAEANWDCVTGNSIPEPLGNDVRQILKRYGLLPSSEPVSTGWTLSAAPPVLGCDFGRREE